MLKADLHIHTGEDNLDEIKYNAYEIIDYAAKLGFEVLSITHHGKFFYNEKLVDYAEKKGIVLIPGSEAFIGRKHVLLYNFTREELEKIKTFNDLRRIKKEHHLVIAPHPFFLRWDCLGKELIQNLDLFDAIEYSHYYLSRFNLNKKAVKLSKEKGMPLIGTSDCHRKAQMNNTYTMIDSDKNIDSVIKAIKKGEVKLATKPINFRLFMKLFFELF